MNKLTAQDLDHARAVLEGEGPVVMYKYLAARGDRYAILASGVVSADSVAGSQQLAV